MKSEISLEQNTPSHPYRNKFKTKKNDQQKLQSQKIHMKITSTRLIYLQPVVFKTISFHHQSEYFIQFQIKYSHSNQKDYISAYPSMVKFNSDLGFNRKRIFKRQEQNKVQTQKFIILFNDQSIIMKGGCNFVIQSDRNSIGSLEKPSDIDVRLVISLWKYPTQKTQTSMKSTRSVKSAPVSSGKLQKVGEEIICINLNVLKDYSEHSSYRHIMFKKDQYFSSLLFYIDIVHLGTKMKPINSEGIDKLGEISTDQVKSKVQKIKNQFNQNYTSSTLRSLLPFKDLRKLYKLLIQDRLLQFKRIVGIYYAAIQIRLKYINNYEIQQPQNIQSLDFQKKDSLQNFTKDLSYLQSQSFLSNSDFYEHYQTDEIDEVYMLMFEESKLINLNIRKVWERTNILKIKTMPEEFMTYALKFKIDRMTYITPFYAAIDQLIYPDPKQMAVRIQKHKLQRRKVADTSRFYNINELRHSMLTFHSIKAQSIISNTSQRNQSQILVVLVHGYQGSQRDMAKIKSFINTFTSINFLPLETLSKQKNKDIATLGKKGADQIIRYLVKKPHIQSINMIGFSLGGIIVKAILMNLEEHKSKFNLYMTLSSPHLGISQIQNCLVATGVLWMKKVNKSKNIKELCCEPLDKKQGKITLLNLSEQQVLSWFNHVVLIGSNEDTYVSKYSSLLAYKGDNKLIQDIQNNTLRHIKSMDKITVWFQYDENIFEKMTGRKGHISFIEDDTFIEYIIAKYLQFF